MRVVACTLLALCLAGCGHSEAELEYAAARAALVAGDHAEAERRAEAAARAGGDRFEALRAFLRGNVAFARCEMFEPAAEAGDNEAYKSALKNAEDALAYWRWAAKSRDDWPAARRNVERALFKLAALREKRRDGKQKPPQPPAPTDGDEAKPPPDSPLEEKDLPAGEVLGLFDVLVRRDAEKIKLRRAQRATAKDRVERDW